MNIGQKREMQTIKHINYREQSEVTVGEVDEGMG